MVVTELQPVPCDKEHKFFSDADLENCFSTKSFTQFSPMETKDQLIICKKSRQIIFGIPRSNSSFDRKSRDTLKDCLLLSLQMHPNNINQLAKRRHVEADKWSFDGGYFLFSFTGLVQCSLCSLCSLWN